MLMCLTTVGHVGEAAILKLYVHVCHVIYLGFLHVHRVIDLVLLLERYLIGFHHSFTIHLIEHI